MDRTEIDKIREMFSHDRYATEAGAVIEAVDDEMGEDYAKLAGLTSEEDLKETVKH